MSVREVFGDAMQSVPFHGIEQSAVRTVGYQIFGYLGLAKICRQRKGS